MSQLTDRLNRLDDKATELEKALYFLKSILDLYRITLLNTRKVRGGSRVFFTHVRQVSLEYYVLGLCKLFEQPGGKRYELHTLHSLLDDAASCNPLSEQPLRDFVAQYAHSIQSEQQAESTSAIDAVRALYAEYMDKHSTDYRRLRNARDKRIAHFEFVEGDERPKSLPSYEFMERLLFFAVDLHSAISRAYGRGHPHPIRTEQRVSTSLCSVLRGLGVNDVQTRFEDDTKLDQDHV